MKYCKNWCKNTNATVPVHSNEQVHMQLYTYSNINVPTYDLVQQQLWLWSQLTMAEGQKIHFNNVHLQNKNGDMYIPAAQTDGHDWDFPIFALKSQSVLLLYRLP